MTQGAKAIKACRNYGKGQSGLLIQIIVIVIITGTTNKAIGVTLSHKSVS